jgi:anti-sigma-K factor RskA
MEKIDITSGILELYVSGALPPEQMEEVTRQLEQSPELKAEVEQIEAAFMAFAEAHAPEISSATQQQILASGKKVLSKPPKEKEAKVRSLPSGRWRWLAVAASILLLFSLGLNFVQYQQLQQSEQELAELQTQDQILSDSYNRLQARYNQKQDFLANLRNPNTRTVTLSGTGPNLSEDRQVRVFWNEEEQLAFIDASQLPEPPEGKVYQLWRLSSLQPLTPHDAGLLDSFSESDDKIFGTQVSGPTAAFAITLEPEGGSENPTLEQLYVLGQV